MKDISLKDLLEAGCHFGHKVERWYPKAASFIYGAREGIHIIDLAKTKEGLAKAAEYLKELAKEDKNILFVATKRQSKGVAGEAAKRAGLPYLTNRWIGGFMTNWDEMKKNIDKVNRMRKESAEGAWQKFPKHEQIKLEKDLRKLKAVYDGVAELTALPDALFIVDIKREHACLQEAVKKNIPVVAIVDTNADPNWVDYPIPANDDAVGSIQYITNYLADAYMEGRKMEQKGEIKKEKVEKAEQLKVEKRADKKEEQKKKRGRPKKSKP